MNSAFRCTPSYPTVHPWQNCLFVLAHAGFFDNQLAVVRVERRHYAERQRELIVGVADRQPGEHRDWSWPRISSTTSPTDSVDSNDGL